MNRMGQTAVFLMVFGVVSMSGTGFAANTDDVSVLKQQIAILQKRVSDLEQSQAQDKTVALPVGLSAMASHDEEYYDPFADIEDMQRHMNGLMSRQFGTAGNLFAGGGLSGVFSPGYDIKGTDKAYLVTFDMPGMDKSKINVEVKNGLLLVSGERSSENQAKDANSHFYRQERSFGYFSKSIPLPKDAKSESVQAKYENGVLLVTIDKKEPVQSKEEKKQKIEVK